MRKNVKKITPEGKRLKSLLEKEKIKQVQFASLIGVSTSMVSDFIYGRVKKGGIKLWDGIRRVFPDWENEIRGYVKLPPENSKSSPGAMFVHQSTPVYGYIFKDKKNATKCIEILGEMERLDADLFVHAKTCLQMLLDGANIISKKSKRHG